jgi:DNA-binding MarR family transcriptional regulator
MHEYLANQLGALALILTDRVEAAMGGRSSTAAAILASLRHQGPMTGTGLARVVGVAQPTCVRVVDGLAAEGLVERGPKSGRDVLLQLTASGAGEAERLGRARLAAIYPLLDDMTLGEGVTLGMMAAQLMAAATDSPRAGKRHCRLCDHGICNGEACPVGARVDEMQSRVTSGG